MHDVSVIFIGPCDLALLKGVDKGGGGARGASAPPLFLKPTVFAIHQGFNFSTDPPRILINQYFVLKLRLKCISIAIFSFKKGKINGQQ